MSRENRVDIREHSNHTEKMTPSGTEECKAHRSREISFAFDLAVGSSKMGRRSRV